MNSLTLLAFFFILIQSAWADALPLELLQEVPKKLERVQSAVLDAGRPPTCQTPVPFQKILSFDSPACLKEVSKEIYKEFYVCSSGSASADAFLYYQVISGTGNRFVNDTSGYGKLTRSIFMNSFDRSLNGTFLTIQDSDKSQRAATQMGTDLFLLPRITSPSLEVIGNEIHMMLPTGEEVVFDAGTREIKSGALKEGEFQVMAPSTVEYSGTGISIRMDLRTYDDPRRKSINAVIKQGSKTCSVPRGNLFGDDGIPKSSSDGEFLASINRSCPGKGFSL
jgi:hypothetical protein